MNPKNQRRALCRPRPIAAMVGFWLSMLAFFFCTLNSRAQGQGSPPGVKTQPQNQSVLAGSSATFSVIATGSPPLSYRWIGPTTSSLGPDATNAVLILPKVDAANGGAYFVEVTNQFGMVHSSNAFLFVTAMDFGDAPLPYPTMLTNDGARHIIVPGVYLGHGVSYEPDGQPDPQATADSLDDGVVFLTSLVRGNPAAVQVVASVNGFLDAWIDFRGSSNWQDTGNQIFTSAPLNPGTNILSFNVPAAAITGVTYARFRFSTSGNLRPNGLAQDGEVEDFRIPIVAVAADLCISNTIVPVPVLPGTIGHSLLLVTNIGPSVAANVIVTNVLAGVDFISVQAEGGSCTNQNDTIVCSLGNLALHETRNILIDFKPRQNSALTNFAFVRSDTPDPNPVNNRAVLAFRAAPPLVIVTPPRSQEVTIGGTVTFSVEAKGFGTLSYQWYSNGIPILDATGQTFTLQNAQDSAAFQVQVFDAFGNVFSPLAFLAVVKPPQLLGQPASLAVAHGTSIEFLTQATGTPPLRFQWRLNGLNIRGATNPVYLITNSTRFDAGTYTVAVGNDAGVITSEKALLTCTDIPIYNGSDAFGNRTPLPPPGLPNASPFQGIVQTDNSNATREAGEPFHAGKLGGASI
ncbi:MAG TPA: immunoglobulin domain-containing protein, partial [Verrucomicrobiae bacterium]